MAGSFAPCRAASSRASSSTRARRPMTGTTATANIYFGTVGIAVDDAEHDRPAGTAVLRPPRSVAHASPRGAIFRSLDAGSGHGRRGRWRCAGALSTGDAVARRRCSSSGSVGFSRPRRRRRFTSTSPWSRTPTCSTIAMPISACPATNGQWTLSAAIFLRSGMPRTRRGWIRQTLNPYSIDSVLRIVHTLLLSARRRLPAPCLERGPQRPRLPVHRPVGRRQNHDRRAGAGRRDRADRRNFLRPANRSTGYVAFGTPFAGDRGEAGEPISAPVAALFRPGTGRRTIIGSRWRRPRRPHTDAEHSVFCRRSRVDRAAARRGLRLRRAQSPAFRLTFAPDARVWSTIT